MIYFLQSTNGGPIKIGCTSNLEARRQQLEKLYGCPLVLLASMKGDKKVERAIHARFDHLRLDRKEQFLPAPELMVFINRPLLVSANSGDMKPMVNRYKTIGVRCSEEWRTWVEEGSRFCRLDVSKLVELAVIAHAKNQGFEETPPRRT